MIRKQSFLERLTGTRIVNDEAPEDAWQKNRQQQTQFADEETVQAIYPDGGNASQEEETFSSDTDEEAGLAIDMYESDNELIIQSMIAGVTPENLHISITRDSVSIKGKRVAPAIPEDHYVERGLYWGSFSSEIPLPFEIDTEGAEAVEKYGLLIIRLPKLDASVQELKVKSLA